MPSLITKKDILKLTVEQRLDLMARIFQTIDPEEMPLSEETMAEMERRLAWARKHPEKCLTHKQMMSKLRTLARR